MKGLRNTVATDWLANFSD